jgi:hypothetical protein
VLLRVVMVALAAALMAFTGGPASVLRVSPDDLWPR